MFTRLSVTTSASFTTGETVSGASNGGTGIVQSVTATKSTAVTSITASGTDIEGAFSAAVVTLANHGFVDGQQVELFEDESITLTQSIQDVRDIAKIFTEFTRQFSVPASKNNNRVFQHFYNQDIVDGLDARQKIKGK